jgi:hypothetical protein
MNVLRVYKKWRLRRAQERHAYWKAKREALAARPRSEFDLIFGISAASREMAEAAGKEAAYLERVETFMRDV